MTETNSILPPSSADQIPQYLVDRINQLLNSPSYSAQFSLRLLLQSATWRQVQLEGYDQPQQLITGIDYRLEAVDSQGQFLDSRVNRIQVPLSPTDWPFVPVDSLDLGRILFWPTVYDQMAQAIAEFQVNLAGQLPVLTDEQELLQLNITN